MPRCCSEVALDFEFANCIIIITMIVRFFNNCVNSGEWRCVIERFFSFLLHADDHHFPLFFTWISYSSIKLEDVFFCRCQIFNRKDFCGNCLKIKSAVWLVNFFAYVADAKCACICDSCSRGKRMQKSSVDRCNEGQLGTLVYTKAKSWWGRQFLLHLWRRTFTFYFLFRLLQIYEYLVKKITTFALVLLSSVFCFWDQFDLFTNVT